MIEINLLHRRTHYNYQDVTERLGSFYCLGNELDFFADHQELISNTMIAPHLMEGKSIHVIPETQNPIVYNLQAAIDKMGREKVQAYWQTIKRNISFDAEKIEKLISKRRRKVGAVGVSAAAAAALLFVFQDHIRNLLPRENPDNTELQTSPVPEMPKSESSPPQISNPPALILQSEANHQAEQTRRLQEKYEQIITEMHQYLNPQGTTLEQCDQAIQQWTKYPNQPDQQQMIAQWGDVRRRVLTEQSIRVALEKLLIEGDRNGAVLSRLDQLVNPNSLSSTTVESAIADWQRSEFANHPHQAEMLASWRRWKSLLELQEKIHELVLQANATLPRHQ